MSLRNTLVNNNFNANLDVKTLNLNELTADTLETTTINNTGTVNSDIVDANEFKYTNVQNHRLTIKKTLVAFTANTPLDITNYDIAQDGTLPGFDPVTGIYTVPQDGYYYFEYRFDDLSAPPKGWSFNIKDADSSSELGTNTPVLSGADPNYLGGSFTNGFVRYLTTGQRWILRFTSDQNATNTFIAVKIILLH